MNSMNSNPRALRAAFLLALLIPFALPANADEAAKAAPAPTPAPTAALHEIGATPTPSPAGESAVDVTVDTGKRLHHHGNGDDRVAVMGSVRVNADEDVRGAAVAVLGSVRVDGSVSEDAVAVLGSTTVNGTVHGNAVAVLGNLTLGPNARVDGDVVCIGGTEVRDPGAFVGGQDVHKGVSIDADEHPEFAGWLHHGLSHGHLFLPWARHPSFWIYILCLFAFYALLALAFPTGIAKCGDALVQRPGITFLTGVLSLLAVPFLFILLFVTLVGIPVAVIVLPLSVIAALLFGKAAIYSLVGRSILGTRSPAAVTTLVGAFLLLALYFVPFLGGMLWTFVGFLGFSCALTALFTSRKPATPPPMAPAAAGAPAAPVVPPVVAPAPDAAPLTGAEPPVVFAPPLAAAAPRLSGVAEAALPRAGFWIRMVALLIDFILMAIVTQAHGWVFLALAVYGAVLWKLKGATVGDIIFGLKVVRMDGNPSDWVTMIVRALACFFSFVVLFLGFLWIAFDREKQGWHDKIAGTVVVKLPRGASLV
jgi:uncharacterized RDD family membrane protein YckC